MSREDGKFRLGKLRWGHQTFSDLSARLSTQAFSASEKFALSGKQPLAPASKCRRAGAGKEVRAWMQRGIFVRLQRRLN